MIFINGNKYHKNNSIHYNMESITTFFGSDNSNKSIKNVFDRMEIINEKEQFVIKITSINEQDIMLYNNLFFSMFDIEAKVTLMGKDGVETDIPSDEIKGGGNQIIPEELTIPYRYFYKMMDTIVGYFRGNKQTVVTETSEPKPLVTEEVQPTTIVEQPATESTIIEPSQHLETEEQSTTEDTTKMPTETSEIKKTDIKSLDLTMIIRIKTEKQTETLLEIIEREGKNEERQWERMTNGLFYEDLEKIVKDLIIQKSYMKKMNVEMDDTLDGLELYNIDGRYILLKGDRTMNDIISNCVCNNEGLRIKEFFDRKEKHNVVLW